MLEKVSGLKEPDGRRLPDIHSMGADPRHKDLFVEIGAMKADKGTAYGSATAPFSATTPRVVDEDGHNHMPSPAVLKMVGDAYNDAPVSNPDGRPGIKAHFDVGPFYHFLGAAYRSTEADRYLVPWFRARGGEAIKEVACVPSATLKCQFPDFPGTVSWKIGFQLVRDAIVGPFGEQLTQAELDRWNRDNDHDWRRDRDFRGLHCDAYTDQDDPDPNNEDCRRTVRHAIAQGIFHYLLYAHARGMPKSVDPHRRNSTCPGACRASATCPAATAWSRSGCGTTSSARTSRLPPRRCTSSGISWTCGMAARRPCTPDPRPARR